MERTLPSKSEMLNFEATIFIDLSALGITNWYFYTQVVYVSRVYMSTLTLMYIYQNRGKNIFVQNENCWAWVLVYESLFQLELFPLNLQFLYFAKLCLLEIVTKIRCNCSFVAKLSSEPSSSMRRGKVQKLLITN